MKRATLERMHAALRGHFDRNAGQREEKSLAKNGDAHSAEKKIGDIG